MPQIIDLNLSKHDIRKVSNQQQAFDPESELLAPCTSEELKKSFFENVETLSKDNANMNVVYQVVYPDDLNLKHTSRGRPKKPKILIESPPPLQKIKKVQVESPPPLQKIKKVQGESPPPLQKIKKVQCESPPPLQKIKKVQGESPPPLQKIKKLQGESPPSAQKTKAKVVPKTRSGREVKFPKHIEKEFKKIEINDRLPSDSVEVIISNFEKYPETGERTKPDSKSKLLDQPNLLKKKRRISAQYRCPKCKKAYLGRNKILEHLKKNPSHGSLHQDEEKNFEVWNYLVNVTQKCPSSERGQKFCQELSNLLHNLLLLTNALFKKLGSAANEVKIDKVLGNAIGLTPGSYYFDDNNLYKNVTVLKLMANNDFLHSVKSKSDDSNLKSNILSGSNCDCGRSGIPGIDELFLKSMLITAKNDNIAAKQVSSHKASKISIDAMGENERNMTQMDDSKQFSGDTNAQQRFLPVSVCESINSLEDNIIASNNNNYVEHNCGSGVENGDFNKESALEQSVSNQDGSEEKHVRHKTFSGDELYSCDISLTSDFSVSDYEMKHAFNIQTNLTDISNYNAMEEKLSASSPKIKIQSNILICPPRFFQKNATEFKLPISQNLNSKNGLNPELLTDNSVLIPLSNSRHSIDEFMLPAPSEPSSILDNSSSSDEVMNVDQFVNERFRKITESDVEITTGNSLNLELPSLDLFQFHTS